MGDAVLLATCLVLWTSLIATRRNWRVRLPFLLPAAAILLALLVSSCGAGSSSVGPGPPLPGPTPASALVVTGTSGNVSHAATAQLTVNSAKPKGTTTLCCERVSSCGRKSLPILNFRASLLDASLDQFGFHFGLLPGKKPHFGFKCPVSWQRHFDTVLSRTYR